ncbi:hypothetical protein HAL09_13210 [Helicobacter ailurogastricus]|uniref:Uncharacterized protein n=1 Tax=Helicobacter ailurogastricus TaxID=1578720 RepID=A0A0K2XGH4_9HELI|nr:hypothetical protein HAL09_13210 [Helicobacter ailurogastricus]
MWVKKKGALKNFFFRGSPFQKAFKPQFHVTPKPFFKNAPQ